MPRDILNTDFSPGRSWVPTKITKDVICALIFMMSMQDEDVKITRNQFTAAEAN